VEAEEFRLVRDALHGFATGHRCTSADTSADQRAAAQKALDQLGLAELRRDTEPLATAQECALLAEEYGKQPLATSFLGTVLMAPEILRLLGTSGQNLAAVGTPTIALGPGLRFASETGERLAWDTEGADGALCVEQDGTVRHLALGSPAATTDTLRPVCSTLPDGAPVLGRLTAESRQAWQAWALVLVSSELVGAARSFVEQSTGYARDRIQYGRPIGSNQAVQHLLADATVAVEACASATRYAAWCLDHTDAATALTAARVAKAEVDVSALDAVYTGMQVFGGIAQTWEHIAHLYLRRVRLGTTLLTGTAQLLTDLALPASEHLETA
jgi:hypothetical protein